LIYFNFIIQHLIYWKLVFLPFFFPFLSIKLSWSYAHGSRVCGLTRLNSYCFPIAKGIVLGSCLESLVSKVNTSWFLFFQVFFFKLIYLNFIIQYLIYWKLILILFFFLSFYWVIPILYLWSRGLLVNLGWFIFFSLIFQIKFIFSFLSFNVELFDNWALWFLLNFLSNTVILIWRLGQRFSSWSR
jgi:hypothetical protein